MSDFTDNGRLGIAFTTLLILILSLTAGLGKWVGAVDAAVDGVEKYQINSDSLVREHEKRLTEQGQRLVRVETTVENINETVKEIKAADKEQMRLMQRILRHVEK